MVCAKDATPEEAKRFGEELAKVRSTPTGDAFFNLLNQNHSATIVIRMNPRQGQTGVTSVNAQGGSITFRPGMANIDDIAHEFQHAAEGVTGKTDPVIPVSAPTDTDKNGTSQSPECRATRAGNIVRREYKLQNGLSDSPKKTYSYGDKEKIPVPYPYGPNGPK